MVVDVIFVDERTGEVIPMTAKDKDKEKKKLKWLKILGIFVVGIFYGYFTGGGGFRVNRIELIYLDPKTGKQIES
jgi:uncharacterized membrane protein YfcA